MRSWLARNETGLLMICLVALYLGAAGYRVYWIITHDQKPGWNAPPDPLLKPWGSPGR